MELTDPPGAGASPAGEGQTGPLRVALLSPRYWPEVRRGTERFARDLADGLLERGHRPRLITSHQGPGSTTVEQGLLVRRNRRPPEGWLDRLGLEHHLAHGPLAYGALRRGGGDVAHALHHCDALATARWTRQTGRPSVFSFMGIPHVEGFGHRRLLARMMRAAAEGNDAVVVLGRVAAERLEWLLGVEARVIPPGVDTEVFKPGGVRSEHPTIFCAADAAEPRKRVALLVEAFGVLRRSLPQARLVLSRPRDGRAAAHLRALDGVEVRDVDESGALVDAYREAWVSVLPSYSEAFGLVLLEALACGTPIVGSNVDGIPELLDGDGAGRHFGSDGVGRLFDGDAPGPLAAALRETVELARDPGTAVACRARAEQFSRDRCTDAYVALYRELLARR